MRIPRDMIILTAALTIASALPAAQISGLRASPHQPATSLHTSPQQQVSGLGSLPHQPTSHVVWRSGALAVSDTLRTFVRGGDVLIIDLPEEIEGQAVGSYSLLHAPALSWLIDYSFMWRTLPEDAGMHNVLIQASGPADTLVVAIVVE